MKPDFLPLTACFNIQVTEALATGKTMFFRPTSMADAVSSFSFYTDSYFNNIILNMYPYYDTVEYTLLRVQYTPPYHLSGGAWTGF
jgi:hypothetical protein